VESPMRSRLQSPLCPPPRPVTRRRGRLLLVADRQTPPDGLESCLSGGGFAVDRAEDGRDADGKVRSAPYDVIVLDVDHPGEGWLPLLQPWRRDGLRAHVLVLGAPGDTVKGAVWRKRGADDWLARPPRGEELLARLDALDPPGYRPEEPVLRAHDLEI